MKFEVVPDAYDEFMGVWSKPLAPQLVEFAGVRSGDRVLDVGCGTGALTEELVARVGRTAVSAVDPSESFVAAIAERVPGVDGRRASAEALPFGDSTFDAALAQLVVHFMADPVAGLREMARVTRTGGVVAACVWDMGTGRGPLVPFWPAVREADPTADDESERPGTWPGQLAGLLHAAGLRDVEEATLSSERRYVDFDAWWEPFTLGVGPAGAYVLGLDAERRASLAARCRAMLPVGPFVLTAVAWAARGVVGERAA